MTISSAACVERHVSVARMGTWMESCTTYVHRTSHVAGPLARAHCSTLRCLFSRERHDLEIPKRSDPIPLLPVFLDHTGGGVRTEAALRKRRETTRSELHLAADFTHGFDPFLMFRERLPMQEPGCYLGGGPSLYASRSVFEPTQLGRESESGTPHTRRVLWTPTCRGRFNQQATAASWGLLISP